MAFGFSAPLQSRPRLSFPATVREAPGTQYRPAVRRRRCLRGCVAVREAVPVISTEYWDWHGYGRVRYLSAGAASEVAQHRLGQNNNLQADEKPTILFVPGFGICSSDFRRNIPTLAAAGFRVFAIDKLGLGESLPANETVAKSITVGLWRDQIIAFIEQVLDGEAVFLAGNSLGGLLCASVSAVKSNLVRGAVLFNPAPFWVVLPSETPRFIRAAFRALLQTFWVRLTRAEVIKQTLAKIYARPDSISPTLVDDILAPTRYKYAKDVFESVLSSPVLERGFDESIRTAFAHKKIPLALVYGREDPWVVPLFGLRVKGIAPDSTYYELSPCGHCAHAEAPEAVNAIVENWVRAVTKGESPGAVGSLDDPVVLGGVRICTRDGSPQNFFEKFALAKNYYLVFISAFLSTFVTVTRDSALD